jgi:Xaa-Pro aminopeptidase
MNDRRRRLAHALQELGYDAFLLTQRPNQLYFTPVEEFSSLPPVPFVLIHGDETLVVPGAWFYHMVKEWLSGCTIAETPVRGDNPETALITEIRRRGLKRVAVDYQTQPLHTALARELPAVSVVEDTHLGPELRRIKEPGEIERMRRAAAVSDLGIEAAFRAAAVGVSNRDIAAEASYAMLKAGAEIVSLQVCSGPGTYSVASETWQYQPQRVLQENDMLLVDMGIYVNGYLGDQTRTAIIGEGTLQQKAIVETVQRAYRATRDAMRPGANAQELYAITVEILRERGWEQYFPHHISHGLGLGGDLPRVAADSNDVLQAGDTLSCEPGVYIPGVGGARFENMIHITPDGAEELTRSPLSPVVGS